MPIRLSAMEGKRFPKLDEAVLATMPCCNPKNALTDPLKNREYFRNTREPFAITVAGTRIYIMTSSEAVSVVFKDTEHLTFDEYIRDMMIQFGTTPEAVAKMWQPPSTHRLNSPDLQPNPRSKSFLHLSEGFYRQQLHPGEKLDNLQDVLLG